MTRALLCLSLVLPSVFAERVTFETEDGVKLVADFHPAAAPDAPTVVCIPMYRNNRSSYAPLLGPLKGQGFHVLALDPRGHGESAPELRPRVTARDAALFNALHRDVAAAVRFLEAQKGCDATRICLVGASVGCSVAVDYAVRAPHRVRGVVLLTPGANYLDVPTLEHLKSWPGTRILTFCSNEEQKVSQPVIDALKAHDDSSHMILPEGGIHGTRMFGKVKGVEQLIANFLYSARADLKIQHWQPDDPVLKEPGFFGKIRRPRRTVGGTTYSLFVWAVGDTWHFGGMVDTAFAGVLEVKVGAQTHRFPFDTATKAGPRRAGDVTGQQASFRGKTWIVFERKGVASGAELAATFRPQQGAAIGLPAGEESFRAVLEK